MTTVRLPVDLLAETPPTEDCRLIDLGDRMGRWCAPHGQHFPCRWAIIMWLRRLSPIIQSTITKLATWRHLAGCEAEFADDPHSKQDPTIAAWLSACAELRDADEQAMERLARTLVDAGIIGDDEARPVLMPEPK